ncbi:hypothetical protein HN873_021292, partial [Arachis hypogaea]
MYCREEEIKKTEQRKENNHRRIEQTKDNVAERRKRALETIREKRSKKRNDGAQSANIAPDQFDSPKAQNEFSQICPLEPKKQSVTVSLTSSVIENLIKDDYVYEVSDE